MENVREFNECINAAHDLLGHSDPVKAKLVVLLLEQAFQIGKKTVSNDLVSKLEGSH